MEPAHLLHTTTWLLGAAMAVGVVMAALRFAKDRGPPIWMSKAHGALTCAPLALLVYGWATVGLPKLASTALILLLLAAVGGVAMTQAWRWKQSSLVEVVLFGHLTIAAAGFFLLLAASMG